MGLQVVHIDESLIVLEKPAGLPAVPGRGAENQVSLATQVQQQIDPEAFVVHRLDRDTSGLMVMARGLEAQRKLSQQFEDRKIEKRYTAIVFGSPDRGGGTIELPIRKDFDRPPRQCVDFAQGRPAITEWRVVERHADRARLELAPLTGRSHQLRLHLEQIEHPILGDKLYAHAAALAMASRLLLHSTHISLAHPASGGVVTFRSACPF
ncbi:MAG TPA: RluA family pseudouridine synthase [Pirellulales bacterium]|jgi:tRNA pseudouridine32 synthase/23S rRNA pseudouridine746 synthase|nr:RluA family pseudouridine synthase [Pirellulales bacterium]